LRAPYFFVIAHLSLFVIASEAWQSLGLLRHYRASRGKGFLHTSKGDHTPPGGDINPATTPPTVGAGLVPALILNPKQCQIKPKTPTNDK